MCRQRLIYKRMQGNVRGKIINLIRSMYQNAKSCVKVKEAMSEIFTCNMCVRQGENLSPLLFDLYVGDIEELIRKGRVHIKLDDQRLD